MAGRPKGVKNGEGQKQPKRAAKGRNYFVVSNEQWQAFKAQSLAKGESLAAAQEAADGFAQTAEANEPGKEHSFAVIEEAGVLTTKVQTHVKRNFTTSRSIERIDRTEGNKAAPAQDNKPAAAPTHAANKPAQGGRARA